MITVAMSDLIAASTKLSGLALESSKIDILKCVHLSAEKGQLKLKASNMDIEAECFVPCEGDLLPSAVNASRLFAVIKTASKQSSITITKDGDRLKVAAGRSKWDMPSLAPDLFPALKVDNLVQGPIGCASSWRAGITKCKGSQSTQINQPNLCGIFAHTIDGNLALASTNGVSLHMAQTDMPCSIDGLIIPSHLASVLTGAMPDTGEINSEFNDRLMRFSWQGCTITGKTIDGVFPDYKRIIPAPSKTRIIFDTSEMLLCIAAVLPIADHKSKRIKITVQEDRIIVENIDQNSGKATSEIMASVDGFSEEICFAINGIATSELLSVIGCETSIIDNADNVSKKMPVLFSPTAANGFSGCISPMGL